MNNRAKFTVVALLSVFAMASNPAKADVLGFSVSMTAYMRNALSAPRATVKRHSPTVTVAEVGATAMETITVVATRLPPLATESLAQAADSHTRL
jgi:hypothetical protein